MINAYLGLDIGGTNVKYLVSDSNLNKIEDGLFPTNSKLGIDEFVKNICLLHDRIEKKKNLKITSIGIGCTGPLDIIDGIILNPYTLPGLEDNSIVNILEKKLKKKVYFDNDANVAHLGELYFREQNYDNSIMLTFGTGVGCSVRVDKKIHRTKNLFHPEIGHIFVSKSNSNVRCYCGKVNCAENILSGTSLNRDAKYKFNLKLEDIFCNPNTIEKRDFIENIKSSLCELIMQLTIIFNPEIVIIGGGLSNFYNKYIIKDIQERLNKYLPIYGKVKIECSKLKNGSGSLGAICTILEQEEEIP